MMPKSTATRLPSSSTNRLPGCMSAWKKPSRSAWRRKVWITARASALKVEALGGEPRAVGQRRAVDPFEREHVARGAVPVDRRHAEIRIVLGVLRHLGKRGGFEPQIHLDRDRAAQRLDHLDQPQPPRLGRQCLGVARRRTTKASMSTLKRRSTPGRSTLTATALRPPSAMRPRRGAPARSRRRRPADRTTRTSCVSGLPSAAATVRSASACGNGAILSCSVSRSRASATPTTSGRVARNWPSFT